jgi:hypothetical protein
MIPYSAKVKTPLKGVVFKLLDTMEPASSQEEEAKGSTTTCWWLRIACLLKQARLTLAERDLPALDAFGTPRYLYYIKGPLI